MINNTKAISIWVIPFFTACGGLYLIAYWDTFNVNGLTFIEVEDIIKSFIQPCISFVFIYFISVIISEGIFHVGKIVPNGEGRETKLGKKLNSEIGISISLILWLVISILIYKGESPYRWIIFAFFFGIAPSVLLDRIGLWNDIFISPKIRIHTIRMIVFLPLLSFAVGKYQSELIQKNIKFQYISSDNIFPKSNIQKADTLKYLGYNKQYFILTDLKNKNIIFVRSNNLDFLQFKQFLQ